MRKLLSFVAVGMLTLTTVVADDKDDKNDLVGASARLLSINASGIKARALFIDSGMPFNILVVSATATGLDPAKTYISLLYDNGSVPTGPTACEPTGPSLTGPQMFIGQWVVKPDGTGKLFAAKAGPSYTKIGTFHTMSVRVVIAPGNAPVRACGVVRIEKDE